MKRKMSTRTLALLAAAILLFAGGAVSGTRAALNIQSDYYIAQFYLNHLQVHLIENGKDVCGGHNNLDGESKITGQLATALGYKSDTELGTVEPGKLYQEEIAARNGNNIDEFVRLTVRKYWAKTDENGNVILKDGLPEKAGNMDPAWIHLYYGGSETYNSGAWTENPAERTEESSTYYYKTDLDPNADSALIFDQIMIDRQLAKISKVDVTEESAGGVTKKIYKYIYKYDGCAFYIEADVQAIQTHNINEAIKSQWGVDNVTGSYSDDTGSGTLSVN